MEAPRPPGRTAGGARGGPIGEPDGARPRRRPDRDHQPMEAAMTDRPETTEMTFRFEHPTEPSIGVEVFATEYPSAAASLRAYEEATRLFVAGDNREVSVMR